MRGLSLCSLAFLLAGMASGFAEEAGGGNSLQWFQDARFGIFVHWGIYSIDDHNESWSFRGGRETYDEYMSHSSSFTAENYDPEKWGDLFAASGAKYVVLTTKHHDGFALWDTKESKLNAAEASPARRDLVGPFCDAMRKHGLRPGLYFSLIDWSHPDYASVVPKNAKPTEKNRKNKFSYPQGPEDAEAWNRFVLFYRAQLKELCTRYSPALFWFDGDWERDAEQWGSRDLAGLLRQWDPGVIFNNRIGGGIGDYRTPEQALPVTPPKGPWEYCVTLNGSWGYSPTDANYKSVRECLWLLAQCASMGGNMLLDVGPKPDGTIPPPAEAALRSIGRWLHANGEAVYGTTAGLPPGFFGGPSTLGKDGATLYLFFTGRPGELFVQGIQNNVRKVSLLGGGELRHHVVAGAVWAQLPGVLTIDVPETGLDPDLSVLKVELDGPLNLYRGAGAPITAN